MPIARQVRITRSAISPRFATKTLWITPRTYQRLRRDVARVRHLVQGNRLGLAGRSDVQHLDEHAEAHGSIDVALADVRAEALGDEHHADHEKERQGEHLHRRMAL